MVMFPAEQRARRRYRLRTGGGARRTGRDGLGRRAVLAVLAAVVLLAVTLLVLRDPAFRDALWTLVRSL